MVVCCLPELSPLLNAGRSLAAPQCYVHLAACQCTQVEVQSVKCKVQSLVVMVGVTRSDREQGTFVGPSRGVESRGTSKEGHQSWAAGLDAAANRNLDGPTPQQQQQHHHQHHHHHSPRPPARRGHRPKPPSRAVFESKSIKQQGNCLSPPSPLSFLSSKGTTNRGTPPAAATAQQQQRQCMRAARHTKHEFMLWNVPGTLERVWLEKDARRDSNGSHQLAAAAAAADRAPLTRRP